MSNDKQEATGKQFYETADKIITVEKQERSYNEEDTREKPLNQNKITAVEWLYNLSKERELDIFDLQQAKVQHKQEIIDAYRVGAAEVHMIGLHKPDVYYTETYFPSLHGGEIYERNNTVISNPGPNQRTTTGWKGGTTIDKLELETLMIMYLDGIEFYGTDGEWVEARTVLESFMRYVNTLD